MTKSTLALMLLVVPTMVAQTSTFGRADAETENSGAVPAILHTAKPVLHKTQHRNWSIVGGEVLAKPDPPARYW